MKFQAVVRPCEGRIVYACVMILRLLDQKWPNKSKSRIRHCDESGIFLDIAWYPERVPFIRRNTHKYKYKFFSYKKVAPKVAPFFVRWTTGGGIVLRAGKKSPWRSASPSCSTPTSARQGIMPPPLWRGEHRHGQGQVGGLLLIRLPCFRGLLGKLAQLAQVYFPSPPAVPTPQPAWGFASS